MLPHNSLHTGMQIGSVEVPQVHHRWGWKRREETAKGIADSPWPFPGRCWGDVIPQKSQDQPRLLWPCPPLSQG